MTIARAVAAATLLLAAVSAAPARAQSVDAELLFREGRKLMKQGKIAEACDKFEASNRIQVSAGTLLNLGDCREKNDQLATAWATFGDAASAARTENEPKREAEARRREKLLEPRLAHLTITVGDATHVDGLQIARNGKLVDPALWNQPIPVDVGPYEVVAQAPGRARWSKRIAIGKDGDTASVDVPPLEAPAAHPPPHPAVAQEPATAKPVAALDQPDEDAQRDEEPRASRFTPLRDVAIGLAAVGVAGVVGGIVLGGDAQDLEKRSDALCPTAACNDAQGVKLNSDARDKATQANIAYIAGGAAIAGGVVLWFVGAPKVARDHVAVAPVVTGDRVGVAFAGRF